MKQITPDERKRLAETLGVNEQYLYQCLTGRRDMNPAEAMRLEIATDKQLTRQMLCQSTYAAIWPDLAESQRSARNHPNQRSSDKPKRANTNEHPLGAH